MSNCKTLLTFWLKPDLQLAAKRTAPYCDPPECQEYPLTLLGSTPNDRWQVLFSSECTYSRTTIVELVLFSSSATLIVGGIANQSIEMMQ
jgi:hypothetical protein